MDVHDRICSCVHISFTIFFISQKTICVNVYNRKQMINCCASPRAYCCASRLEVQIHAKMYVNIIEPTAAIVQIPMSSVLQCLSLLASSVECCVMFVLGGKSTTIRCFSTCVKRYNSVWGNRTTFILVCRIIRASVLLRDYICVYYVKLEKTLIRCIRSSPLH